jgi:drug/metabolite transporter (DMT)-like permease
MLTAIILILFSTGIRLLGLAIQKKSVEKAGGIVFFTFNLATIGRSILKVFRSPMLLSGYFITVMSTLIWFILLATYDLKIVIPLGGLSYAIALMYGRLFFKEKITLRKLAGLTIIFVGTYMIFQ